MKKVISQCPVCDGELSVVRLKCAKCGTVIENDFTLSKFDYFCRPRNCILPRHLSSAGGTSKKWKRNWESLIPL